MGLGKPKLFTKIKVASFNRCKNIKGEPQILGSSSSPGPHPLFLLLGFDDGPWQTQLHAKFEVAGYIYYENIREFVFKRRIRFLSHPLGELGITYGFLYSSLEVCSRLHIRDN